MYEQNDLLAEFRVNKVKYDYLVTITNFNGVLHGNIKEAIQTDWFFVANITADFIDSNVFDPLTILGDLIDMNEPTAEKDYPLLYKHDFIQIRNLVCSNVVKNYIQGNNKISLSHFEVMKQSREINIKYFIYALENKLTYKENRHVKVLDSDSKHLYRPVRLKDNVLDMKTEIESYNSTPIQFAYLCKNAEDMVSAILHYLILFEYKFNKCNHCGSYFATKTYKKKYCNKKSPYKGYGYLADAYKGVEHLECEKAVRNIYQSFTRRFNGICTNLSNSYKDKIFTDFTLEYEKHLAVAKKYSSVENLKILDKFLSTDNIKENWYKKENRHGRIQH